MIIFTHHTGEPHGILGAQVAATFFNRKLSLPSIVVGIERNFSRERLLDFVDGYYSGKWTPEGTSATSAQRPCGATAPGLRSRRPSEDTDFLFSGKKTVAFSHLCGRKNLMELIHELKQMGFITLLGGPQSRQDYVGEPEAESRPYQFSGLKSTVDVAVQGPVDGLQSAPLRMSDRLLETPWTNNIFLEVDWSNIYTFSDTLKKLDVRMGQVLNAVGCAYACKPQTVVLPPPTGLREKGVPEIEVRSEGCIFCDVSRDKGFHGALDRDRVVAQMKGLPEIDGIKIPFELIDEYPIRSLARLMEDAQRHEVKLSQINLVCRVDDINTHASDLVEILSLARNQDIKIMFSSIGFESFCDRLLQYFSKGITVEDIVKCVETLRRLKDRYGSTLLYRRQEGANHGFIRPTPWDDSETMQETDRNIFLYRFFEDILPEHSTPLIIHHASYLGDWIRQIESTTDIMFSREGTWIEWWNPSSR
jgi:hypothetical protein